jgi:hypothetical protein
MFEADDHGSDADCRELKYTCPARDTLVLKEGAMVILLRNLSAGKRASSARARLRTLCDTLAHRVTHWLQLTVWSMGARASSNISRSASTQASDV